MKRGDVVLVGWPFTDFSTMKVRPAVVISSNDYNQGEDCILVAVSSSTPKCASWDVPVQPSDVGFGRTGLHLASTIQCGKLLTVSRNIIKRRLGAAGDYMPHIESGIKKALGLK
jgi:mRNA interferase MazF